jgi:hypothetical protein
MKKPKHSTRQAEEQSLGSLLSIFKQQKGLQKGFLLEDLKSAWAEEMGPGVANYTTAIKFERGILYVSLSSSTLREELSYGVEKIKGLMNERFEEDPVKKVILR